ncbi:hypothetical protein [Thermoactinomyces mirandus]|uniref:Uncharacterized protein n=1 Tax=Thermoactinomyces mirandus TaxID=2756294 RepID=A0A7W1XPF6_9BACL|nr:hypothetical protein [Thermoactinomyces mirandus]MBA4600735.1 hypothetical protein [Thermoactinomyces mirandus]
MEAPQSWSNCESVLTASLQDGALADPEIYFGRLPFFVLRDHAMLKGVRKGTFL